MVLIRIRIYIFNQIEGIYMKTFRFLVAIWAVFFGGMVFGYSPVAALAQAAPVSVSVEPVQYASVKGNVDKFRELNWTKDGYTGGITDISFF